MKNLFLLLTVLICIHFSNAQDLISGGTNSWRFHTPDDGRSTLYIAPLISGSWSWANQTAFFNNGNVLFNGNIGIGTSTISERLNVAGNLKFASEYNQILWPVNSSHPFGGGITADDGNYKRLTLFHGHSIDLQTGSNVFNKNNSRLYIDKDGKIGIGTRNVSEKLNVAGNLKFTSEYNQILWPINATHPFGGGITADDGNYKRLTLFHGHSIDLQTGSNVFNKDNSRLYVSGNGNIGIGTRSPDAKLTVKGKIHAEEVKIDLSVPAPDYVFKKEYNLLPIEEVQQHIQEKGHLPNIPSAKILETEGVELGLMNMKLLEKIEELTLYTINQEERIKNLEEKLMVLLQTKN